MPKIRIKQSPTGPAMFPDGLSRDQNPFETAGTLQPVARGQANIEAEKGETILGDFDHDGDLEHMNVGGSRHTEGGTPLNVPDNSFVFSDTKDMRLKGDLVKFFGKNPDNKKGYTPAEMAKQYDINKYKAVLDDPESDPTNKRTAELMVQNYQDKLGKLAFLQEAHKGFPNGIPQVAQEFAQSMLPHNPMADQPAPGYTPTGQPQFAVGGETYDVDPYHGGKEHTPTGKSNGFNNDPHFMNAWEKAIPGISQLSNQEAQGKMYDYMLKNNPDQVKQMWQDYGLTNQGQNSGFLNGLTDKGKFKPYVLDNTNNLQQLRSAYTDGMFGARQFDPNAAKPAADNNTGLDDIHVNPFSIAPTLSADTPVNKAAATPPDAKFSSEQGNYDTLSPDRWSMDDAMQKRASLKKYLPYISTPDFTAANPTFYDPTRELVAGEENQNSQLMANAMFASPQQARAAASSIGAQGAAHAADTIGKYDNMNVGVANQFSEEDAREMNQYAALRAKDQTDLYNGNVIANQQFDTAKNAADNDILKTRINAWNNRSEFEAMNKTNKLYQIDPETGHMVFTPSGKEIYNGAPAQQGYSMDNYPALMQTMMSKGMTHEEAHKIVLGMIEGERETQTYKGTNPIAATTRFSGYQYPVAN